MNELKKAIMKLINFGEKLEGALQDHRITLLEGVYVSAGLGSAIFFVVQNRDEIEVQVKKLADPKVREEIKQYVKDELDLDNDRVEAITESTLDLITDVVKYIDVIKKS